MVGFFVDLQSMLAQIDKIEQNAMIKQLANEPLSSLERKETLDLLRQNLRRLAEKVE